MLHPAGTSRAKSYYDYLALPRNASPRKIQRRYRQLSQNLLPSKPHKTNSDHLAEVDLAFAILSESPRKKQFYDECLRRGCLSPEKKMALKRTAREEYMDFHDHNATEEEKQEWSKAWLCRAARLYVKWSFMAWKYNIKPEIDQAVDYALAAPAWGVRTAVGMLCAVLTVLVMSKPEEVLRDALIGVGGVLAGNFAMYVLPPIAQAVMAEARHLHARHGWSWILKVILLQANFQLAYWVLIEEVVPKLKEILDTGTVYHIDIVGITGWVLVSFLLVLMFWDYGKNVWCL